MACLLVACTAAEDGAAPVTPCTTRKRTFAVKPADHYLIFEDEAAALAAMPALLPKKKFLAAGSAGQKHGQEVTNRVFDAYKTLYPEAVEGLPAPPTVIVEDDPKGNAYAPKAVATGKVPYFFAFASGYLAGSTDEELAYVAAHELGHLLLRNGDLTPIHFSAESGQLFGEYAQNDPELEKTARASQQLGDRAGQLVAAELNGFPTPTGILKDDESKTPRYGRYLAYLHQDYGLRGAKAEDCLKAAELETQIEALVRQHTTLDPLAFTLGADAAQADTLTKAYWAAEASCLSVFTGSYESVVAHARQNHEDPAAGLSDAEMEADANDPNGNIATKLATLGKRAQLALRDLYAAPKYRSIRVFTAEDDSDHAAVRIGRILGYKAQARVDKLLTLSTAEYQAECRATLATGVEPSYGGFIDPHHGICWRGYRTLKLEEALKTCASTWPQ